MIFKYYKINRDYVIMYYTEDEFTKIEACKNELVQVITNKAASSLSPSIIQLCETIGHRHYPSFCTKCSSGRFNILTRLYYRWLDDKKEKEKINESKANVKEKENGGKTTGSKTNRKK